MDYVGVADLLHHPHLGFEQTLDCFGLQDLFLPVFFDGIDLPGPDVLCLVNHTELPRAQFLLDLKISYDYILSLINGVSYRIVCVQHYLLLFIL